MGVMLHADIVDPDTYAYLGMRVVFVDASKPSSLDGDYTQGEVIIAEAQVAGGIVDHAGDVP